MSPTISLNSSNVIALDYTPTTVMHYLDEKRKLVRFFHQFFFLWFLLKDVTQLARQVHQERTQVVCSDKVGHNRPVKSNGTPAMDPGYGNIDLF